MSSLIGTWELVEWTATVNGRRSHPFGGNVAGRLTYTPDGHMWATLMRRDRDPLESTTLAGATASDRASAAAGYLNYSGRYTDEGERVVHHVDLSLMPNWVGDDQVRNITWRGDELELSTEPEAGPGGSAIVNRLRWKRVSA